MSQSESRNKGEALPAKEDAVVLAQNLSKSFGVRPALRGVDCSVQAGEFVAIYGPNGAGKTTFLKCLAGLSRPSQGQVRLFGKDPRLEPSVRRRFGFVAHAGMLHEPLTGRENLELYGRLYDVEDLSGRVDRVLNAVEMEPWADDPVRTYSRGMRQRCSIARAIIHDPDLLLLDEPFTGLDPVATGRLAAHFRDLIRQGRTILLVTHEFEESLSLVDRVLVISKGQIVMDKRGPQNSQSFRAEYLAQVGGL